MVVENGKRRGKSCWTCAFQKIAGMTFLGVCTWFERYRKGKNKDIPSELVDIGCKHWQKKGK